MKAVIAVMVIGLLLLSACGAGLNKGAPNGNAQPGTKDGQVAQNPDSAGLDNIDKSIDAVNSDNLVNSNIDVDNITNSIDSLPLQ